MRSWIFRHRLRLRAIYSPRIRPEEPITTERSRFPRHARTESTDRNEPGPGEVWREGHRIMLRPMVPPAA